MRTVLGCYKGGIQELHVDLGCFDCFDQVWCYECDSRAEMWTRWSTNKKRCMKFWCGFWSFWNGSITTSNIHELMLPFFQCWERFFKVLTPTGFGPSVSGASVCLSVSDPFLIGCEKLRDKILGFWLSWHKFNLRQLKCVMFISYLIFACSVQS